MKISVIGGGIGGLIAALLLRKEGHDVTIFEKQDALGGRLQFVQEGDYRIDAGPTIVLLPTIIRDILSRCGIGEEEYRLIRCDPIYDVHFSDGVKYRKYAHIEDQLNEIKRIAPEDEKNFQSFMKDMQERYQEGSEKFLNRSFINKSDLFTSENLRALMKLKAYESTAKLADKYFQNRYMREAYNFQTLYVGGNPFSTPAIYNIISFSEHEHGVWYVEGGYASLVEVLHRHLIKNGVRIHLSTPVSEISVKNERAYAVIANEQQYDCDLVVGNADYPIFEKLLPQSYRFDHRQKVASSGCYLLYLGVNKVYDDQLMHQFLMGDNQQEHMKEVFHLKQVPKDPSVYVFNPSVMDSSLAPEGHSVLYVLVPVPSGQHIDWKKQTAFKGLVLDKVEQLFPEIREHIVWEKVKTPNEAEKEGMFEGGSFGLAPTLFQSAVFRPQVKPTALENVYAVGASTHPGGGIPIVMLGVQLAMQQINDDYKSEQKGESRDGVKGSL